MSNNNSSTTTTTFPYSLQPQPPPHPKTTGGKRAPSAPITIPFWARGVDDDDEDSDQSITDHTPPTQTGRLASFDHAPNSCSPSSCSLVTQNSSTTRGPGVVYAASQQVSSPRGHPLPTTGKKFGQSISSPRTLFNNNNTVTLNLNHQVSSSPSSFTATSALPTTTPILIIHTNSNSNNNNNNNNNSSKVNGADNVSGTHSSSTSAGINGLPAPGSSFFAPTNTNTSGGSGLTTSHPPAPWVASQNNSKQQPNVIAGSAKHSTFAPASSTLSKVPKLVDNPIQPRETTSNFLSKGQKSVDSPNPSSSSSDSSLPNQTLPSATNSSSVPPAIYHSTANKGASNFSNGLVVGIPDSTTATKPDSLGSSTLLLSPSDVRTGSPDEGEIRPNSPTSSSSNSCFAYELDHDYENVASPCSSTASGPTYVRQPGFRHHAHEVTVPAGSSTTSPPSAHTTTSLFSASLSPTGNNGGGSSNNFRLKQKKKCSATLVNFREGFKKREATPPKLKPKREPLPMKLRALPQSFWQQPNVAHQVSPATLFPILPPLPNKDTEETLMEVRPVTPPEERDASWKAPAPERKLTVANTDLLFKLFDVVADDKKSSVHKTRQQNKPQRKPVPKSNTKGLFLGNDPYMVDAVTEKIFPQLTLEAGSRSHTGAGNSSLQLISLKEGDRTVQLPSLSMEQNYPQMLSELVMHI